MFLLLWQGIGISAHVDTELPRTLAGIVGNTYTFQLKLTDFNFTANHQTFTISRMFAAPEIAPTPSFAVSDFPFPLSKVSDVINIKSATLLYMLVSGNRRGPSTCSLSDRGTSIFSQWFNWQP